MRIETELPAFFSARIPRKHGMKTIAVPRKISVEIPHVATGDAPVVFSALIDDIKNTGDLYERNPSRWLRQGSNPLEIREYDGRLYKRIDAFDGKEGNAFPEDDRQSPISRPIRQHFAWKHAAIARGLNHRTWPDRGRNTPESRIDFKKALDIATDVDETSLVEIQDMHSRVLSGVIDIGGDIWIETRAPCLFVDFPRISTHDCYLHVRIGTGLAPSTFENTLSRRFFPIWDIDAAMAYAESLRHSLPQQIRSVTDRRIEFEGALSEAFDFDAASEFRGRFLAGLAISCHVCAVDEVRDLEGDARLSNPITASFDHAMKSNYVLDRLPDMDVLQESICDTWSSKNRPSCGIVHYNIGYERAKAAFEDLAFGDIDRITLDLSPGSFRP